MTELLALDDRARLDLPAQLLIEPGEDIRADIGPGRHPVIGVNFPKFRDGRGYSTARILREQGYGGDIRAIGDVTIDQMLCLNRTGFSSVAPARPIPRNAVETVLSRYPAIYQRGASNRLPLWALRHGGGEAAIPPSARRYGPADADALTRRFDGRAEAALAAVLTDPAFGKVALVSSFGAESAVLLHQAAQIRRDIPVLVVDTGWLFAETRAHAHDLIARLGLVNVRWLKPDPALLAEKDPKGLRWSYDPDGCCHIRKVLPLEKGLAGYDLWISGRKRHQSSTRAAMALFEAADGRLKLNPLAGWTASMVHDYARRHDLPPHPLVAQGYPSIGCSPCTSRVLPGEDPRAGRWRGWEKSECGIHTAQPDDGRNDPVF